MWDDILGEIADRSRRSGNLPRPTAQLLSDLWPTLAGRALAPISRPLRLEDGVLSMEVRERALIEEWKRSPRILLRRLRRFSPWPIEELDLVHNPKLHARSIKPTRADSGELGDTRPFDGAEAASDHDADSMPANVDDPQLKSLIESIGRLRARDQQP